MKILMVFTSKFHYTGITSVVMNYYRELMKYEDIKIDFVTPNIVDKEFSEEFKRNGSKNFYIPMKLRRKFPIVYVIKLRNFIKKEHYDIVHVHGSSSIMFFDLFAAKLAGTKIRIAHSHNTVTEHIFLHKLLKPFFKKSYTDRFACGQDAGKWLFENKEFIILPNAQKTEKFLFNQDFRNQYRKDNNLENKIVIAHVGAFNYQKNHEFIVELIEKISNISDRYKFVLMGEGPFKEDIIQQIQVKKLSEKVLFVGKNNKVNEWLNAFDIMILPSRYEGLPNVLIEWQLSGLPTIVSDKVTTEAKITNLITYEELNVEKWCDQILNCKINEKRNSRVYYNEIKKAGFDISETSSKLYSLYKDMEKRIRKVN